MPHGFEIVDTKPVVAGPVVDMETVTVKTPEGEHVDRQVARHPGAVAVVAIDGGNVVLVRQYRVAIDSTLLEIPAGKLDYDDTSLLAAAERELLEEVGLRPITPLVSLGCFYPTAGFCDEVLHIFAGTSFEKVDRNVDGAEEAHSIVEYVPLGQVLERISRAEIKDAKTIIGVVWAQQRGLI